MAKGADIILLVTNVDTPKHATTLVPQKHHLPGAVNNIQRYNMNAVATTCCTVKVASASMARISSGDCCGGATAKARQLSMFDYYPTDYPIFRYGVAKGGTLSDMGWA